MYSIHSSSQQIPPREQQRLHQQHRYHLLHPPVPNKRQEHLQKSSSLQSSMRSGSSLNDFHNLSYDSGISPSPGQWGYSPSPLASHSNQYNQYTDSSTPLQHHRIVPDDSGVAEQDSGIIQSQMDEKSWKLKEFFRRKSSKKKDRRPKSTNFIEKSSHDTLSFESLEDIPPPIPPRNQQHATNVFQPTMEVRPQHNVHDFLYPSSPTLPSFPSPFHGYSDGDRTRDLNSAFGENHHCDQLSSGIHSMDSKSSWREKKGEMMMRAEAKRNSIYQSSTSDESDNEYNQTFGQFIPPRHLHTESSSSSSRHSRKSALPFQRYELEREALKAQNFPEGPPLQMHHAQAAVVRRFSQVDPREQLEAVATPPPPPPRDPRRRLHLIRNEDGRPISYSFESSCTSPSSLVSPSPSRTSSNIVQKEHPDDLGIPIVNEQTRFFSSPFPELYNGHNSESTLLQKQNVSPQFSSQTSLNGILAIPPVPARMNPPAEYWKHPPPILPPRIANLEQKPHRPLRKKISSGSSNRYTSRDSLISPQQSNSNSSMDKCGKSSPSATSVSSKDSGCSDGLSFAPSSRVIRPMSALEENPERDSSHSPVRERRSLSPPRSTSNDPGFSTKERRARYRDAVNQLEDLLIKIQNDSDLLDRAERRDLPTVHQELIAQAKERFQLGPSEENSRHDDSSADIFSDMDNFMNWNTSSSFENISIASPSGMRPRTPSNRRSGVPDKEKDDMAYRMKAANNKLPKKVSNQINRSYLKTPDNGLTPEKVKEPFQDEDEPDIVTDDVQFRHLRDINANNIHDPQPKFGIPKDPVFGCSNSDYLHAMPEGKYRSTFNAMRNPDTVLDDLAFRSLRRDKHLSDPDNLGIVRDPNAANIRANTCWLHKREEMERNEEPGPYVFYPNKNNAIMKSLSEHIAQIIRKQAGKPGGGTDKEIITYQDLRNPEIYEAMKCTLHAIAEEEKNHAISDERREWNGKSIYELLSANINELLRKKQDKEDANTGEPSKPSPRPDSRSEDHSKEVEKTEDQLAIDPVIVQRCILEHDLSRFNQDLSEQLRQEKKDSGILTTLVENSFSRDCEKEKERTRSGSSDSSDKDSVKDSQRCFVPATKKSAHASDVEVRGNYSCGNQESVVNTKIPLPVSDLCKSRDHLLVQLKKKPRESNNNLLDQDNIYQEVFDSTNSDSHVDAERRQRSRSIRREVRRRREESAGRTKSDPNLDLITAFNLPISNDSDLRMKSHRRHKKLANRSSQASSSSEDEDNGQKGRNHESYSKYRRRRKKEASEAKYFNRKAKGSSFHGGSDSPEHIYQQIGSDISSASAPVMTAPPLPPLRSSVKSSQTRDHSVASMPPPIPTPRKSHRDQRKIEGKDSQSEKSNVQHGNGRGQNSIRDSASPGSYSSELERASNQKRKSHINMNFDIHSSIEIIANATRELESPQDSKTVSNTQDPLSSPKMIKNAGGNEVEEEAFLQETSSKCLSSDLKLNCQSMKDVPGGNGSASPGCVMNGSPGTPLGSAGKPPIFPNSESQQHHSGFKIAPASGQKFSLRKASDSSVPAFLQKDNSKVEEGVPSFMREFAGVVKRRNNHVSVTSGFNPNEPAPPRTLISSGHKSSPPTRRPQSAIIVPTSRNKPILELPSTESRRKSDILTAYGDLMSVSNLAKSTDNVDDPFHSPEPEEVEFNEEEVLKTCEEFIKKYDQTKRRQSLIDMSPQNRRDDNVTRLSNPARTSDLSLSSRNCSSSLIYMDTQASNNCISSENNEIDGENLPKSILKKGSEDINAKLKPAPILKNNQSDMMTSKNAPGIFKKKSIDGQRADHVRIRTPSPDPFPRPILRSRNNSTCDDRASSPEPQSILKRRSSADGQDLGWSSPEPQGILKRRQNSVGTSGTHTPESLIDGCHGRPLSSILKKHSSLELSEEKLKSILKKHTDDELEDPPINEKPKSILKTRKSDENLSRLSDQNDVIVSTVTLMRAPDVVEDRSGDLVKPKPILRRKDPEEETVARSRTLSPSSDDVDVSNASVVQYRYRSHSNHRKPPRSSRDRDSNASSVGSEFHSSGIDRNSKSESGFSISTDSWSFKTPGNEEGDLRASPRSEPDSSGYETPGVASNMSVEGVERKNLPTSKDSPIKGLSSSKEKHNNPSGSPNDPCKLTLAERVRLFDRGMSGTKHSSPPSPPLLPKPVRHRRRNFQDMISRFQTQPITVDEVQEASRKLFMMVNNSSSKGKNDSSPEKVKKSTPRADEKVKIKRASSFQRSHDEVDNSVSNATSSVTTILTQESLETWNSPSSGGRLKGVLKKDSTHEESLKPILKNPENESFANEALSVDPSFKAVVVESSSSSEESSLKNAPFSDVIIDPIPTSFKDGVSNLECIEAKEKQQSSREKKEDQGSSSRRMSLKDRQPLIEPSTVKISSDDKNLANKLEELAQKAEAIKKQQVFQKNVVNSSQEFEEARKGSRINDPKDGWPYSHPASSNTSGESSSRKTSQDLGAEDYYRIFKSQFSEPIRSSTMTPKPSLSRKGSRKENSNPTQEDSLKTGKEDETGPTTCNQRVQRISTLQYYEKKEKKENPSEDHCDSESEKEHNYDDQGKTETNQERFSHFSKTSYISTENTAILYKRVPDSNRTNEGRTPPLSRVLHGVERIAFTQNVNDIDLDSVVRSDALLIPPKRATLAYRKRHQSRNPVKQLSERHDLIEPDSTSV